MVVVYLVEPGLVQLDNVPFVCGSHVLHALVDGLSSMGFEVFYDLR